MCVCIYIRNTYFLSPWRQERAVSLGSARPHMGHCSDSTYSPWQTSLLPYFSDLTNPPWKAMLRHQRGGCDVTCAFCQLVTTSL